MIDRPIYITNIEPFIGQPVIKVISGIRRSGKSELLKMIRNKIISNGVDEHQIVYMNFESMQWIDYHDAKSLYSYLRKQCQGDGKHYLFLDEIQEVTEWEKVINSLASELDVDIYLTGSNSRLLSSELSTYLAGRYIETTIYPLSYREYLDFHQTTSSDNHFEQYLRQGGFPAIHTTNYKDEQVYQMVSDIYASVLLRDTVQRHNIRNIDMLERLVDYLFDNIGNLFSARNIAAYLKNQHRKIDSETLYNYLKALESSYIISRCPRYDLKGKEILSTNEKYYVSDLSLTFARKGFTPDAVAGMMENLVFVELKRQGFNVYVGKMGTTEVDFVAKKMDKTVYIQVSMDVSDKETLHRELKPLLAIKDNHPKYVVVGNRLQSGNVNGIQLLPIQEFLTMDM